MGRQSRRKRELRQQGQSRGILRDRPDLTRRPQWVSPGEFEALQELAHRVLMRQADCDRDKQAKLHETFLVHRYVIPARGYIAQVAAMVMLPPFEGVDEHPDGIRIPRGVKSHLPPLRGQQVLHIPAPHAVDWFAPFDRELSAVALNGCYTALERFNDSGLVPRVVVLATEGYRVVGYAAGSIGCESMLLIQSEGKGIKADRVTFIPAAKGVEFPACDIVWTALEYRRRGIGMVLLDAMAKYFRVIPGRLAYDLPLSDGGLRLVRRFAGPRFIGATNRMITVAVPLSEESRLAPCHFRRVLDASESAITKMEGHLASLGYEPEPSHRAIWAS